MLRGPGTITRSHPRRESGRLGVRADVVSQFLTKVVAAAMPISNGKKCTWCRMRHCVGVEEFASTGTPAANSNATVSPAWRSSVEITM